MKRGAKLIATSEELPLLINVGLEDYKKKKTIKCYNQFHLDMKILTTNTT
jgi:hypothetical protein